MWRTEEDFSISYNVDDEGDFASSFFFCEGDYYNTLQTIFCINLDGIMSSLK